MANDYMPDRKTLLEVLNQAQGDSCGGCGVCRLCNMVHDMTNEEPDPVFDFGKPITSAVVDMSQVNGNAFAVLGATKRAMMEAGVRLSIIAKYEQEAVNGDYDHLIQTTMRYVEVRG